MGNVFLVGSDHNTWSEPNFEDLVTLQPSSTEKGFTSETTLRLVHLYNAYIGRYIHVCPQTTVLTISVGNFVTESRRERLPVKHYPIHG